MSMLLTIPYLLVLGASMLLGVAMCIWGLYSTFLPRRRAAGLIALGGGVAGSILGVCLYYLVLLGLGVGLPLIPTDTALQWAAGGFGWGAFAAYRSHHPSIAS